MNTRTDQSTLGARAWADTKSAAYDTAKSRNFKSKKMQRKDKNATKVFSWHEVTVGAASMRPAKLIDVNVHFCLSQYH